MVDNYTPCTKAPFIDAERLAAAKSAQLQYAAGASDEARYAALAFAAQAAAAARDAAFLCASLEHMSTLAKETFRR